MAPFHSASGRCDCGNCQRGRAREHVARRPPEQCQQCGDNAVLVVDLGYFVVGRSPRPPVCIPCAAALLPQTASGYISTPLSAGEGLSHTIDNRPGRPVTVTDSLGNVAIFDLLTERQSREFRLVPIPNDETAG